MKITQIASKFQSSHISRYLKKSLKFCFLIAQKIIAHKIMNGMTIISESIKFKNNVKTRILLANARKNMLNFYQDMKD